ncbi:MAG: glycosyltransferase family 2 protein [Bacteroidia bacterium]
MHKFSEAKIVSVIIPAYNCAPYLAETVESVQGQNYPNIEIIIVNDGSTDTTLEVAQHLAQSDARIKVLSHTNSKQGKTRNAGVAAASGHYIAFLDGDDIWFPNKLELQIATLEERCVDLVFSDGFICLNNNLNLREHTFQILQKIFDRNDLELFHRQNQIPTSTVVCTKAAFDKAGGFDEEPEVQNCEDYLLWVRMLDKGCRFYGLDENLILYRVHATSSTATRINQLRPLSFALMRLNGPMSNARMQRIRKTLRDLLTELQTQNEDVKKAAQPLREYCKLFKGNWALSMLNISTKLPRRIFLAIVWRLI